MPAPGIPSDRQREEAIFESALELPAPERANYLDRSCQNQPAVRARVERLLRSHDDAAFMQGGADPFIRASLEAELGELPSDECGATIGSYKLVEKIGEGGCGIVYRAQQESPIRRGVALKIIKFGTDTRSVIARFQQERQALAMMDHPNIARVFEAGATDKGRPFFVMELVRGVKITTYCDDHLFSTVQRLELFLEVCLAIQHAHQKGIIHRDIKPSNILVTLNDGAPTPKVIDFGIAKATNGERLTEQTLFTAFAHFIGTPAYMSPEQAEMSTGDVDTRSDIYSLGILLYELLTGRPPFDGEALLSSGLDAMRKTIRETEPTRPSLVPPARPDHSLTPPPALGADLDWIVLKCLEKDRSRRYQSASDLAADIQRYLNNEPIAARPPSTTYKIQKAWRRNRLAFAAAAAVATALLVGTGVSTWQAFAARRERVTAQTQAAAARVAQRKAEDSDQARERALHEAQHYLYVANINLAGRAWEQHSYQGVRQRLEETRDFPARGFEWYYWQRQAHLDLKALRGHAGVVSGIAFSPDGQRLVTSGHDATVRIWSVPDGRPLLTLRAPSPANCAIFSPDGRLVASAHHDGMVRFWNSMTGDPLPSLPVGTNTLTSVAFSHNGKLLLTAGQEPTARIWDLRTGSVVKKFRGHKARINSAQFSPDDSLILTASDDHTACLWDASTEKQIYKVEHEMGVGSALFFPDQERIITGSIESATIRDLATGEPRPPRFKNTGTMGSLVISPDGKHFVSGSWDSTAHLWNASSGEVEQRYLGHAKGIFAVAISPDGTLVGTAANEGGVKLWRAIDRRDLLEVANGNSQLLAVAASPDGERIVTGTGIQNDTFTVLGVGKSAAVVWDVKSKARLIALEGHQSGVSSVAYSPGGALIATASGDGTARLWNATTGEPLHVLTGHTGTVSCVGFSPDSSRLVTGGEDRTARVWDVATGQELFRLDRHAAFVSSVAFSADNRWIITGSFDGTARLWNSLNGTPGRIIKTQLQRVLTISCSPDSSWLLTGGFGHIAFLWDLRDDTREPTQLKGHSNVISSSAFSHDGTRVLTGSYDQSARLWEVATGREVLSLVGHGQPVFCVALSRDGQQIFTGDRAGTLRISERATPEQVTAWDEDEPANEKKLWR